MAKTTQQNGYEYMVLKLCGTEKYSTQYVPAQGLKASSVAWDLWALRQVPRPLSLSFFPKAHVSVKIVQ